MSILKKLFEDEKINPLQDNSREERIRELKEQYPADPDTNPSPFTPMSPPKVKQENDSGPLWNDRFHAGPLSKMDTSWKNNLDFLKKEIANEESNLDNANKTLAKTKEDLYQAELTNQDCQKKLRALKDAEMKLQALVPPPSIPEPSEPELLLEKKKTNVKKKVARKKSNETRRKSNSIKRM